MEFDSNQHSLHRLITLLESLFASTHESKLSIEAHSREAQKLLHGWLLPEDGSTPDVCRCAEVQKQQLVAVLDKVGKAVKYSQCVREGRSDVSSPWPDEVASNGSKEEAKKSNSIKEVPAGKFGLGYNRDRFIKGNMTNGSSKKTASNSGGSQIKSSSCLAEKQERHSHLCPVHDGSPKPKNSPTVGLAEALDVKGIPPELVAVLKSVHQFINRLRTSNGKNRSESSFLRHLNAVNETRWNKIPSFSSLLIDLPSLASNEHNGKIPMFEEEKSLSNVAVSQSDNKYPFVGVWNPTIYSTLSVGAFCVQYQNEVIWNLLQMRIQQLQLAQAEWEVCNILSCDPLLCNPELHFSAAPLFLKAATALSRITTLNLPVLVKTCRDS